MWPKLVGLWGYIILQHELDYEISSTNILGGAGNT